MMMTDGWTRGWMGCVKIWVFFFLVFGICLSWRWVDICIWALSFAVAEGDWV